MAGTPRWTLAESRAVAAAEMGAPYPPERKGPGERQEDKTRK